MRDQLVFYVNGTRHAVSGAAAALTLTDYLRENSSLTGTKVACAEGDCGACSVLVGRPNKTHDTIEYRAIDACIAFVYQLDRRHVITVEGLHREEQLSEVPGLTEVQRAMVDCHGSQCGFCTPGFVMTMHGLVEERQSSERECDSRDGEGANEGKLTDDELRLGLSGNLCRCTGYSQILDAGQAFDPARVESISQRYDSAPLLAEFKKLADEAVHVNARATAEANGVARNGAPATKQAPEIFLPQTLEQLLERKAEHPEATLVSGATDLGVQHNHGKIAPMDIISLRAVDELDRLEIVGDELVIGATVSWSRVEAFVKDRIGEYYEVLKRFGSPQIRHMGTLVGNLANASPIADSIPFHYVAGSTVELASTRGKREVLIEDFYLGYKQLDLKPDEAIVSIRTPLPAESTQLKLYKNSKRRDLDISVMTAAFWLDIENDLIREARIATGGVGPTVVRLPLAEEMLVGKPLTEETMRAAGQQARLEVTPISDVRGSANYRLQLVENLFVKCFFDLSSGPAKPQAELV